MPKLPPRAPRPTEIGLFPWLCAWLLWIPFRWLFPVVLRGCACLPKESGVLVISNHPSYLEPPLMFGACLFGHGRMPRYMAWDALFRVPVLAQTIRLFGAFPVNTKRPDRVSYERLVTILKEGGAAGIFPEGSRSKRIFCDSFKPGALRAAKAADVPISVLAVLETGRVWPHWMLTPRVFQRVEVVALATGTLSELVPRQADESPRDWLERSGEVLRSAINRRIALRELALKRLGGQRYRNATRHRNRWRSGEQNQSASGSQLEAANAMLRQPRIAAPDG